MEPSVDLKHQLAHRRFWDLYAADYDSTTMPSTSHPRRMSIAILQRNFAPGQKLLEIGSGTGVEAAAMLAHGCSVVLTDNSGEMLRAARTKLGPVPWMVQLPAENVDAFQTEFDGAYASFGVINCLQDLPDFFRKLHGVLKPNARFVTSYGNRWYLGDIVLFALRRHNYLRRRLRRDFPMSLHGAEHAARARSLSYRQLIRAARPYFLPRSITGIPVFLPPPYASENAGASMHIPPVLLAMEKTLAGRFPFGLLGDQVVVAFERTS
jgi:SAM-dependent methyltransferase